MLDQRRRRWSDIVLMLYNCFVFAGMLAGWCAHPYVTVAGL